MRFWLGKLTQPYNDGRRRIIMAGRSGRTDSGELAWIAPSARWTRDGLAPFLASPIARAAFRSGNLAKATLLAVQPLAPRGE